MMFWNGKSKGTKNNSDYSVKTIKMISTIVIGDVHGSTYWKEAVNENPGCRYIFLGDYIDPL